MPKDDEQPWLLFQQDLNADREWLAIYLAELADWRRRQHANKLAERKADREAGEPQKIDGTSDGRGGERSVRRWRWSNPSP